MQGVVLAVFLVIVVDVVGVVDLGELGTLKGVKSSTGTSSSPDYFPFVETEYLSDCESPVIGEHPCPTL